jgi:hypothetical protein
MLVDLRSELDANHVNVAHLEDKTVSMRTAIDKANSLLSATKSLAEEIHLETLCVKLVQQVKDLLDADRVR